VRIKSLSGKTILLAKTFLQAKIIFARMIIFCEKKCFFFFFGKNLPTLA